MPAVISGAARGESMLDIQVGGQAAKGVQYSTVQRSNVGDVGFNPSLLLCGFSFCEPQFPHLLNEANW